MLEILKNTSQHNDSHVKTIIYVNAHMHFNGRNEKCAKHKLWETRC